MVVGENKRTNIMDGIENTGDVRMHDHRLRLKQRFDIVRKLGQGTYGKVQLGINKKTGQEVAIKTIKKCKIESEADLVRIRREVQIMSSVRHPNIVHIYEVFENSEKMILVMEYCSGGELYDYLSQRKVLEEDEARRLFRQIATAVYYCHIHKICHRDLKLENVLLDDTGSAKIADFGLSNVFKETSLLSTFCGSPLYASPEIVKGTPYIGPEVDCWSLGVLLYTLVYGAMPFDGSNFKRLVRQISNGDYYEPKTPSTASPLIRDMLTVDPLKRADITYICDNPWVNSGYEASCLEVAEALAAETPVRLDLLLSLAPAAPSNSNSVVVPSQGDLGPEESCTDLTSSASMAVEPSNSAEKRILDLVAEGGEDAIKPSPTRTIVSANDNKRKLELAMSASGLQRKKDKNASATIVGPQSSLPEEELVDPPTDEQLAENNEVEQPSLKSSATMTISPAPAALAASSTRDMVTDEPTPDSGAWRAAQQQDKIAPTKDEMKSPDKQDEPKVEQSSVSSAAEKLTSMTIAQPPASHSQAPTPPKPKKLSIPGGSVGSFKEQFERRASLTSTPDVKRNLTKPVVSKIAKPKAQSEDREVPAKAADNGTVRLQQIGIEPSPSAGETTGGARRAVAGGVKKTESEPAHNTPADPSVLLQDARRSLQNSMAKLVEEKASEETRRRTARDIITSAIRSGKPPVPYGRSSSAGVTSLVSPPGTPPTVPSNPRLFRTEAQHRVEDHRNRGVSVERIIPIHMANEDAPTSPPPQPKPAAVTSPLPNNQVPLRRLVSNESSGSGAGSDLGEPIKKSPREFIIPIAVEGKGYVTPRQRSLEPEQAPAPAHAQPAPLHRHRAGKNRLRAGPLYSSIVSGGESDDDDDTHSMHRLRSTRAARAESVSSGEEDEEDERFHLLTAENLFSTLLHRVRALTNRLNGEEGPGFPQHPHSLLQSPFFNSPHLTRRHLLREGWTSRDFHSDFDSMFNKSRQQMPRGNIKKSGKHLTKTQQNTDTNSESGLDLSDLDLSSIQFSEKEMQALSGLTPALSRRLQRQLLASLPPAAARSLRRTLSLHAAPAPPAPPARSRSSGDTSPARLESEPAAPPSPRDNVADGDTAASQFCTLPRIKRSSVRSRETMPTVPAASDSGFTCKSITEALANETGPSRESSLARKTPERPLLSKYLTPERNMSLDDSYSSDSGSILSEPSYIAAYGSPSLVTPFRRHSMRLNTDREVPKKRISRFLRPDFFDAPPDESLYAKHKKEKELETQKILKEIREKKNKVSADSSSIRTSSETDDISQSRQTENSYNRKSLSPISVLSGKERSRSITPFFPILDNIKETILDTSLKMPEPNTLDELNKVSTKLDENKESKLIRPKSYPAKKIDGLDTISSCNNSLHSENDLIRNSESKEKLAQKESKLMRPKSYPTTNTSPEKQILNRDVSNELPNYSNQSKNSKSEVKTDVEVTFSISLPKKNKGNVSSPSQDDPKENPSEASVNEGNKDSCNGSSLTIKKYEIIRDAILLEADRGTTENNKSIAKLNPANIENKNTNNRNSSNDTTENLDIDNEKKGTIKKKIIRKVSSKTKTDIKNNQEINDQVPTLKKRVTKKIKEKSTEDCKTPLTVGKKKSVLQSIGQKLEKLTSSKSSSPEKNGAITLTSSEIKKNLSKLNRAGREQSVPITTDPPTESNLIKRAVTVTDVAALENTNVTPTKTTVSKVLGLFKKFEPKDKSASKTTNEKNLSENSDVIPLTSSNVMLEESQEIDKPKRPTSLLLNGLGRKNKVERTSSVESSGNSMEKTIETVKKEKDTKTLRDSLKLDFSRLPRVKKIVPTNPVIQPQYMTVSPVDKDEGIKREFEKSKTESNNVDFVESLNRSRSKSRSVFSNSDQSAETKLSDRNPLSPSDNNVHHPLRNHESTSPDKEDIVERIRRKSFYTRFNEKKQRRKSNLVGPGATEYDPVARLHGLSPDAKYDLSPTSVAYDISPGFSVSSDLSPSTERYRPLLNDLSFSNKRLFNYGLNDKIDTYRSLDRNDFRKYGTNKTYVDYEQTPSYEGHRYARTKSLLHSSDDGDEHSILLHQKEPQKYGRTLSMYSPGSYATYRPKRTRNSAIILKENEKEPSPENILEKIKQRKNISISVTRKPETENILPRSNNSPKSEEDGTECSQKTG